MRISLLLTTLLLTSIGLAACSSNASQPDNGPLQFPGLPGLAALDEVRAVSTATAQDGADAAIKSPDTSVAGTDLTLAPAAGSISFAIYEFASDAATAYSWLGVECSGGSDIYIAVSNYTTGTWEFHAKQPAEGEVSWDLTAEPGLYSSGSKTFVALIAFDEGYTVSSVTLKTAEPLIPAFQHSFGPAGPDFVNEIAPGPDGSFYLAGGIAWDESLFDSKVLAMRIGADGSLLWAKQWGQDISGQEATDCAVDSNGNLYVCAVSMGAMDYDIAVLKFAPDGTLLQKTRWAEDGRLESSDEPTAIAVTPSNEVVVTGYCGDQGTFSNETEHSMLVLRLSSDLTVLSATFWDPDDTQLSTEGAGLAVDAAGNAYVTGVVYQPVGVPSPPRRLALVKFGSAGGVVSETIFENERLSVARDVVYDSAGGRLVISYSDDVAGDWHDGLLELNASTLQQTGGRSFWSGGFQYAEDLKLASDGTFWLCGYGPAPASLFHVGSDLVPLGAFAMQPTESQWEPRCILPTGSGRVLVGGLLEDLLPPSVASLTINNEALPLFATTTLVDTTSGTVAYTTATPTETASDAAGTSDTSESFYGQAAWIGYDLTP